MNILERISKSGFLEVQLQAVCRILEKEFGTKFLYTSMNKVRERIENDRIKKEFDTKSAIQYPYGWIKVGALAGVHEEQNSKLAAIHGNGYESQYGKGNDQRATVDMSYSFPVTLDLEFHFVTNNQKLARDVAATLGVLSLVGGIRWTLKPKSWIELGSRLEIPLSVPIDIADVDSSSNPEGLDIVASMIFHTHVGYFNDVAAVNGPSPTILVDAAGNEELLED